MKKLLYWTPRALSIAFILFLSLFALDVFGQGRGFWETLVALTMHLIPSMVLTVAVLLAWRWEWIGTLLFGGAGTLYIVWVVNRHLPLAIKMSWILTIAGPAFLVAALFLLSWWKGSRS